MEGGVDEAYVHVQLRTRIYNLHVGGIGRPMMVYWFYDVWEIEIFKRVIKLVVACNLRRHQRHRGFLANGGEIAEHVESNDALWVGKSHGERIANCFSNGV